MAGQRIHCRIGAEDGALVGQLGLVLAQVAFQLLQLPGLGQACNNMQMLAEIVAQMPGLIHIGAQLHIPAGLHGQQLIFLIQLGAAGVLLRDLVHLVQQQEDAQQRNGHGQHRDDLHPAHQDDGGVVRHTEHQKDGVQRGQGPCGLPERLAAVLPQQPDAPLHGSKVEDGGQHSRKGKADDACGDQKDRCRVAQLSAGIDDDSQQSAYRKHHSGNREKKGKQPDGHVRRGPPAQQPEGNDESG